MIFTPVIKKAVPKAGEGEATHGGFWELLVNARETPSF